MKIFTAPSNFLKGFFLLLVLALTGLPKPEAHAQGKRQVVQLTGIVTAGDSLYGIVGANIYVPKAGRGTSTNEYGYFSLAVLAGDSVVFSSLGYRAQHLIIPKTFQSNSYSVIIEMKEDPTVLPEVRVFPYSTEELFKKAFLAMKLPQDDKMIAKNMSEEILQKMMTNTPLSANGNFRHQMDLQQQQAQRRYMYPTIPLTAWLDIINAIKRGDFKKNQNSE